MRSSNKQIFVNNPISQFEEQPIMAGQLTTTTVLSTLLVPEQQPCGPARWQWSTSECSRRPDKVFEDLDGHQILPPKSQTNLRGSIGMATDMKSHKDEAFTADMQHVR